MRSHYYRLVDKVVTPCTIEEFAGSIRSDRIVKQTTTEDDVLVSTVFLAMDHNFTQEGPPLVFETMVFGGDHDQYQLRYSTWEEAEAGHEEVVKIITG